MVSVCMYVCILLIYALYVAGLTHVSAIVVLQCLPARQRYGLRRRKAKQNKKQKSRADTTLIQSVGPNRVVIFISLFRHWY